MSNLTEQEQEQLLSKLKTFLHANNTTKGEKPPKEGAFLQGGRGAVHPDCHCIHKHLLADAVGARDAAGGQAGDDGASLCRRQDFVTQGNHRV